MILGIDEVGRGAWAGPLVVGACILPDDCRIEGLADSKALTKLRRLKLEPLIKQQAVAYGLGWVPAKEVDRLGLSRALKVATHQAVAKISPNQYQKIIIDGTVDFLESPLVTVLKKADQLVPSVSAAAILAKVARDNYMAELDEQAQYGGYEFSRHVGYGTKLHRQRLTELGVSDQHRRSFKPVAQIAGNYQAPTHQQVGQAGEDLACDWLARHDYQILARNWRTKIFEIDIVAAQGRELLLIEVKTRKNQDFGGGLAAITANKLRKMRRAADQIAKVDRFKAYDLRLAALTITLDQIDDGELLMID